MEFTKYRSQALKVFWIKARERYLRDRREILNLPGFSAWAIDDICANHWKDNNPIIVCVSVMLYYIEGLLIDKD